MAYQEGDTSPPHINVHNEVVTQVQELADERNVDVILPPQRSIGDTEHVKDHNLITDALAAVAAAGGGKVLQVVRAIDSTQRETPSTSFVDVPGMSITITPQKSDSAILIMAYGFFFATQLGALRITDNSDNPLSGAENAEFGNTYAGGNGSRNYFAVVGYATPATTAEVTYKLQFSNVYGGPVSLENSANTGQLYAIELADVVVSP